MGTFFFSWVQLCVAGQISRMEEFRWWFSSTLTPTIWRDNGKPSTKMKMKKRAQPMSAAHFFNAVPMSEDESSKEMFPLLNMEAPQTCKAIYKYTKEYRFASGTNRMCSPTTPCSPESTSSRWDWPRFGCWALAWTKVSKLPCCGARAKMNALESLMAAIENGWENGYPFLCMRLFQWWPGRRCSNDVLSTHLNTKDVALRPCDCGTHSAEAALNHALDPTNAKRPGTLFLIASKTHLDTTFNDLKYVSRISQNILSTYMFLI